MASVSMIIRPRACRRPQAGEQHLVEARALRELRVHALRQTHAHRRLHGASRRNVTLARWVRRVARLPSSPFARTMLQRQREAPFARSAVGVNVDALLQRQTTPSIYIYSDARSSTQSVSGRRARAAVIFPPRRK